MFCCLYLKFIILKQLKTNVNLEKIEKSVVEFFVNSFIGEFKSNWEKRLLRNDIKDIKNVNVDNKSNKRKSRPDIENSVKKSKSGC